MAKKDPVPNEGNVRKIKHVRFEYGEEVSDPHRPGEKRVAIRSARQDEVVTIPRKEDIELGERFGAFYTDAELKSAPEEPGALAVADRTDQGLIDWISEEKPNVDETVAAANGDPSLAQRILDAESAATGGDPRDGVVKGLAAVIDTA